MREDMISDLISLIFVSFFFIGEFFFFHLVICMILEQHSSKSLINNKINS